MAFVGDSIYWVEVEKVVPNPFQPRREFDQSKLQELADSIRMYGVLQPLTVTRKEIQREDGTFYTEYELIAGERRLRASKLAGSLQVPVIIRDGEQNEQEKLELAIIENLQREDLNAVDRALAFRQLADVFGLSHAQVAQKVGRSREYVSNSIRLLGLPDHMLDSLKRAEMMEGHARTLLMLNDRPEEQEVVYKEILLKKLSVREVERIVRKIATDKVRKRSPGDFDADLIAFEKQFTETLGTRVQIQKTEFGGKLTIDYFSTEDLEMILQRISEEQGTGESLHIEQSAADRLEEHTPLQMVSAEPKVASAEPLAAPEVRPWQPPSASTPWSAMPKPPVPQEVSQSPASVPVPPPVVNPATPYNQPPTSLPTAPPNEPLQAQPPISQQVGEVPQADILLARTQSVMSEAEVSASPAAPASLPTQSYATQAPVVPEVTKPTLETPKRADEDESDLYSMRNFGI